MIGTRNLFLSGIVLIATAGCNRTTARVANADHGEINGQTSRLSDLAQAPAIRRIIPRSSEIDFEGRPSSDGRLLSETDWNTGDLAVKDVAANKTIRVTNKGSWEQSSEFAEASVISPDGKSIAYGWFSDSTKHFEVRVMSISGADSGRARTIYAAPDIAYAPPQSWTPDGRSVVAVIAQNDQTTQIAVIPVDGRPARRLKSFDWRFPNDISISPDGQWLAYDFPPDENNGERDVYVVALDGSSQSAISPAKGDDFVVGWSRDGSHLLVGNERAGVPGVFAVQMKEGKAEGDPVLVRSGMWHMLPLGTVRDGTIFYGVAVGTRDIYTAAFDEKSGRVVSQPKSINDGPTTSVPFSAAWSPDGQHIASVVIRGGANTLYGPSDIVIRSLERGEVRRISPKVSRINRINWFPDGKSFAILARDLKGRVGNFRMDMESGALTPLVRTPVAHLGNGFGLSPDGKTAWFSSLDSAFTESVINVLDVATGTARPIYAVKKPLGLMAFAASPDGRQLAMSLVGENGTSLIAVMPTTGGAPREIYRFGPAETRLLGTDLTWTHDSQQILFAVVQKSDPTNDKIDVRALPVTGGVPRSIGIPLAHVRALQVSPDGRHIAFGLNDFSAELWTMEPPRFETARRTAGTK